MSGFIEVVLGGLMAGCVYALIATGMSVVYSISRIITLAQGGFVVLAALTGASLHNRLGIPTLAVVPIVMVVFAVGMALLDVVVIRPAAKRATPDRLLLVTVGMLQAVGGLLLIGWGNLPYTMPAFTGTQPLVWGGIHLPTQYFWIVGSLVLVVVVMLLLLARTELGLAMRATAENPMAARLQGIRVERMRLLAFAIAGAVAGLAGCVILPITFLQFTTVTPYAVAGFIAAVVGGLGSISGAVIGGLLLGLLQGVFSRYWNADLAQLTAIAILVVVLVLRPQGILGTAERVRR
ncbi:branched-chain amino acid ABC transporter permease [Raineyella sp. LH-20]|uniref:branched-chain amino acid ABC transporter permease n=1 Tax=Raineyella sp. LH-20 TaxID=3081204 RepID=UPI002953119B|nr:branched-chain amino acid ABC transporter permease [Raineyella sp. LH-20]WOP17427.1 branched-chain amino acid ABC transporter permease [Raineyella sp. LH-20]